jgi:hypothetical protein
LFYFGTASEEIDDELINDLNVKECNKQYCLYPEELYTSLLINKQNLNLKTLMAWV